MHFWLGLLAFFLSFSPLPAMNETNYFLVILVNARQLDYTKAHTLFKTMAKHPSDWTKNGDVGHAWIYLRGELNGEAVYVEGGHSGELGRTRPKYFVGVMNYYDCGYVDPTPEEKMNPRYEPNPIKYLWASPKDGFFQEGAGGHSPSFAAKIDLTEEQFLSILTFVDPANYNYKDYAITRNQCSSFATSIAALGGLSLEDKVTMKVERSVRIYGEDIRLWTDQQYSTITFSSPDILEKSLKKAVADGLAEDATFWYRNNYPKTNQQTMKEWQDSFYQLSERWSRAFLFW